MTAITDTLGRSTTIGYYPNGTLKSLTDAKGNTTTWLRDIESRVTAKVYADGTTMTYAYEPSTSRLNSVTDAVGQTKSYAYTIDDRLATLAFGNVINPTPTVTFTWDSFFPRLVSMTDGTGTTQYQYHLLGGLGALQLAGEDGPYQNDTIAYQYDALGRVVSRAVGSSTDSVTYDALGRVIGRSNPLGAFSYGYLGESGQPTSVSLAGGAIHSLWNYENTTGDRRLKAVTQIAESVGGIQKTWNYGYDPADRLVSADASHGGEYRYSYDDADNVTSIQSPTGKKSLSTMASTRPSRLGGFLPLRRYNNARADASRRAAFQMQSLCTRLGVERP